MWLNFSHVDNYFRLKNPVEYHFSFAFFKRKDRKKIFFHVLAK